VLHFTNIAAVVLFILDTTAIATGHVIRISVTHFHCKMIHSLTQNHKHAHCIGTHTNSIHMDLQFKTFLTEIFLIVK